MTENRIGEWLRETRLRQVMPGTRKPWSQDYLLDQMRSEGWAPHRPNYSKYETGKARPEPDTLDRFIAFWANRGKPGPDLLPKPAPEPPADPVVVAMDRQTAAITALVDELRWWRTEDRPRLAEVEASVRRLAAEALAGSGTLVPTRPALPRGTAG